MLLRDRGSSHAGGQTRVENRLYFGDNLVVLREHVADGSVDLIYLDPPFNSQARYNVLFKSPREDTASAQVGAFLDFWSWETGEAEAAYHEIMTDVGGGAATLIKALRSALGESDMMAYIVMMAVRMVELRRVLKPTGSLYLHCDPTASHYLKVLLDAIFGAEGFTNEIVWQRTTPKGLAFTRFPSTHDTLLLYRAGHQFVWNPQYRDYSPEYLTRYNLIDEATGRRFQATSLLNPNKDRPNLDYEFGGVRRVWRWTRERMEKAAEDGRIYFPPGGGVPREKRFLDEQEGVPITSVWTDIPAVNAVAQERIGYPTQKPLALLKRILNASSRPGDVVLDPFCGCGTSVEAAEVGGRTWIGIDVSIHAIHVIEQRLAEAFGASSIPKAEGIPADYESAARLAATNPFQFQWWANYLVGVHVLKEIKKGADRGIDGELYFPNGPGRPYGRMLTSVKAGKNVSPSMVRDFRGVLEREKAEMGLFVVLDPPTREMMREAVVAGYASVVHGRIPRLQILSIADWFQGRKPDLPPLEQLPYAAFSRPPTRPVARPARPAPDQPELPFTFRGGKDRAGNVAHLNPRLVGLREAQVDRQEAS